MYHASGGRITGVGNYIQYARLWATCVSTTEQQYREEQARGLCLDVTFKKGAGFF